MMYPGIGLGTERYRSDPEYDDGSGWAINESSVGAEGVDDGVDLVVIGGPS